MRKLLCVFTFLVAFFGFSANLFASVAPADFQFVDVPANAFYAEPVEWLVENEITKGTSPTTFSPDRAVTRGEMAAFLWRRAGEPTAVSSCGFTDVPLTAFYAVATCWLLENEITQGTSPTTFSPNRAVTRGEMAAFLWRAQGRPQVPHRHHFDDVLSSSWYEDGVRWLRAYGVTSGLGGAYTFQPQVFVTRGQMAAFLWRSNFAGEPYTILSSLTVRNESDRSGYNRDAIFGGWKDLDRDGCHTRCEVLEREKRSDLQGLPTGGWLSVFDGVTTGNASSFDIDHVVPLAEAWDSGGQAWSNERWLIFGNDLEDSRSLRAVSASSNRSKGDRDPAEWMPPASTFHCQYAAEWVTLKARWSLSVDPTERDFLRSVLLSCPASETVVIAAPKS